MSFLSGMARPWRLLLIVLISIFALLMVVLLATALVLNSNAGSRWVLSVASNQANNIADVRVEFSTSEGALLRGITLTGVASEFSGNVVNADELVLAWNPFSVLTGNLLVSQLRTSGLSVTLAPASPEVDVEDQASPDSLLDFTGLPIGIEIAELSLVDSTIYLEDQVFEVNKLALGASLVGTDLQLRQLHINALSAVVEGDLDLQLRDFLPLEAALSWNYAEAITEQIDSMSGELSVSGDLLDLNVSHQLLEPFLLLSEGSYQSGLNNSSGPKNVIDFLHTAEAILLPVATPMDVSLENLSLQTVGDIANLLLKLSTHVQGVDIPRVQLMAEAVYAGSSVVLDSYSITTDTGSLSGAAQVDWSELVKVEIDYVLTDSDPFSYLPDELPIELTDLDSIGSLKIEIPESGLEAEILLERVNANLSNYPVTGRGEVSYLGETVQVKVLELTTAENQLSLSGQYGDNMDLRWNINAPRLDQILLDASGSVMASGYVQGTLSNPDIDADVSVSQFAFGPYSVEGIQLMVDSDNGIYTGDLRINNGQIATETAAQQLQELTIDFDGTLENHQIVSRAFSDYGSIDLAIEGGVADLQNPQWLGSLARFNIDSIVGQWLSVGSTDLTISQQTLSLPGQCWSHQSAELCLQVNSELSDALTANVSLRDYPLAVVNYPLDPAAEPVITLPGFQTLPENVVIQGVAAADLELTLPYGGEMVLQASLLSEAGSLTIKTLEEFAEVGIVDELAAQGNSVAEDPEGSPFEHKVDWKLIDLQANLQAGVWDVNGRVELDGAKDAGSDLGLQGVLNLALGISADQNLAGTLSAEFDSLAWLEAFVPDMSSTSGSLNADLVIGGSLPMPAVTGSINLQEAGTTIDRLGLKLSELNASLTSDDENVVKLDASVRSGEGEFSISSQVTDPYTASRELTATFSGNNFQLVNRADLQLALSPDINVQANEKAINFSGKVAVPLMNLQLTELPPSAVDVTRDVVIVSFPENKPELARSVAAEQATVFDIPIIGEIDITLGDNVSFTGFGMDARVGGSLNIRQQANGSNLTYGELTVLSGGYEMYGQRLTLERGKILFLGAADNPAVDIRATRRTEDVPGLAEDITAGVIMNGTIKNLSSQLFSTPVLPENDIIAILVTGKPLSGARGEQDSNAILGAVARLGLDKGQGFTNQLRDGLGLDTLEVTNTRNINNSALTVGKYLTPEIFVRYGLGLFDNQSTVAVDYSVTNNIKLQAESGEYQSVDITYTIEK